MTANEISTWILVAGVFVSLGIMSVGVAIYWDSLGLGLIVFGSCCAAWFGMAAHVVEHDD